jgi:hypothetical protein
VQALAVVMTMLMSPAPSQPSAIAVHWQGQPDHDASLRLSVRERVAARDARPVAAVPDRALARARVAVAYEVPAALRERHQQLRRGLDEADAAYREGRFDQARVTLVQVLDQLHASPELPGAAASAREAQLLTAKLAWAAGELAAAESALAAALRIDPEAQLSVREAAPELVARYLAIQAALLDGREREWIVAQLSDPAGAELNVEDVEIDGVPGLRAVPPGPHFLVARREGHEPVAAWQGVDQPWVLPAGRERIPDDPSLTIETIAAVCEALALDVLLLAERRDQEIGLQAHRCGVGFGPRWTGAREALADGVVVALDGPFTAATSTLTDEWPAILVEAPREPTSDRDDDLPARPWYRRGWIWGTSAGVAVAIVGGVAAGVLVNAREQPPSSLDIDAGKFIGGL